MVTEFRASTGRVARCKLLGFLCFPDRFSANGFPDRKNNGYVKFEVETGASPGWSPMVIYKGALVNIWLKG